MKKSIIIRIFLRSFLIHATFNLERLQNLGFAYAMMPLLCDRKAKGADDRAFVTRHLQAFNTHPYLSAPIIGSVARMEADAATDADAAAAVAVKQGLMGPYAAIGDPFFWGALRPCAAILAVVLAYLGSMLAPLVFLLVYNPPHLWVRTAGFIEGWRKGKNGIEFIRKLHLPWFANRVRWVSLSVLAASVLWLYHGSNAEPIVMKSQSVISLASLVLILLCVWLIRKGVSQVAILYGAVAIFFIFSLREYINWWT